MAEQPNPRRRRPTTLNDLPSCLLIHILTLMPIMEAIETSFISRQWRNLWHLMPTLKFDQDDEPLFSNEEDYDICLADTINQVLANRPKSNPLREFDLYFNYAAADHRRHCSFATTWIRYALECNVEEMSLCFQCSEPEPRYPFHFVDIKNRPLRCLKLWRCEIVMPHLGSIQFHSLRVLYLHNVLVDDESLTDLISRCKNLEELCLGGFHGLRHFKISSQSLQVLTLKFCFDAHYDSSIEFHTPNLFKFRSDKFSVVNYAGDLSSVKLVLLGFRRAHTNLEKSWRNSMHLDLFQGVECLKIKELLPRHVLSERCFQLEMLKHLEVQVGYTVNDMLGVCMLLERAPALELLIFKEVRPSSNKESFSDELSNLDIKLHIPSLLEVTMIGFSNTKFEHGILLLLWKHGVVLNKVVLVPAVPGEPTSVLDPTSNDFVKFLVERRID